jgi:hypothetical protein
MNSWQWWDRWRLQWQRIDERLNGLSRLSNQELWNIARKPTIYDNAFHWPKIWQANRDQIKNPDIIYPGQNLKIPPKAELTAEEKFAARRYGLNRRAAATATNPY